MIEFFKKMLSASSEVSHKRVIVCVFALAILSFCYIGTFTKYIIPEFMFDALCYLVAAGMGLTLLDRWSLKSTQITNSNENPS